MKKTKLFLAALAVLASPLLALQYAGAGGSTYDNYSNLRLKASKTSATANGSDSITFTISFYKHKCVSGVYRILSSGCADQGGVSKEVASTCAEAGCKKTNYAHARVTVTGSGNTLSSTLLYPDGNGSASFTLKSTAAGGKTVKISNEAPSSSGSHAEASKGVTFSAPAPAPAPASTPTTTTPKTTETKAPSTPKPTAITVDGQKVDPSKDDVEVEQGKPLVLSGKTVANGVVKLYIFSEPKTATVKADKNGNWTYTVSDLPAGDHHVESEVTDPATGKTSKRETVLAFTVKAAETQPSQESNAHESQATKSSFPILPIAGGAALLAAAGAGFWIWKKKKSAPKIPEAEANSDGNHAINPQANDGDDASDSSEPAEAPKDDKDDDSA